MTDRYLFRGKRPTGAWVIGGLTPNGRIFVDSGEGLDFWPVLQTSIGQCTGLRDKNGKLIFEGDIVINYYECRGNREQYSAVVEWDICNPSFLLNRTPQRCMSDVEFDFIKCGRSCQEIIGNIYDNPELLGA